jgi:streptogrisin C
MFRTMRTGLAAAMLAAAIIVAGPVTAAQAGTTLDEIEQGAAEQLATDWRVSFDEAAARIARQDAIAALADDLSSTLEDRFGGLWVDHARGGEVAVGTTDGSSDEVVALARRYGLERLVAVRQVRYGQSTLDSVVGRLAEGLVEANADARTPVSASLRTDLNQVELTLPTDPTPAQRAYAAAAVETFGAAVTVTSADEAVEPAACSSPTACDKPLQGGVHIHSDNGVTCTGAFNVKSGNTKWMLTAGHCLYYAGFSPWQYWWTKNNNGTNRKFGGGGQIWWFGGAQGRDFAIITVDYVAENPQATIFANASGRTITGTGSAFNGMYMCKTGQTTGYNCGNVTSTNYNAVYSGGIPVNNMIKASIYTCKGDSGGPNYLNHTAYGVTSGMTNIINANCGNSVITGKIGTALSVLGVSLL